ncbi:MAG: DUF2914 domain-containing protein [Thermoanaerobaculaceae bacterium]|jgi:hypothetical protein|nr:DUF2914 domain-containing protein [Thermoanaerobaculaceae bacterium]
MRKAVVIGLVAFAVLGVALVLAEDAPFATAIVCTGVKDRTPEGAAEKFPASVGQLTCFSEIKNGRDKVVHVWYHGDTEVRRVELPVKAERWRTWSVKNVAATMTGPWRVDVVDADGKVLASSKFVVE